ncbi:MAG: glycine--tRNA ligase subunit beta [Campylobacteraceae bacterium]|nr:glycine--tRNA ligase subunit beta [Campylobacteraceae bacterium]
MRLLIEIGVEELPAIPFLKELDNVLPKWNSVLDKFEIKANFDFDFTPRRLVLSSDDFPQKQDDKLVVTTGAPKHVALKDGKLTQAALSFAKKCGISEDELKFKEVDGKEVLYFEKVEIGKPTKELLESMIGEFLDSLHFGKTMRWGDNSFEFIRPIRSIICLLDDQSVDMEIYGVKSESCFYPHRSYGYEKVSFKTKDEYFTKLEQNGVVLSYQKREEKILKGIKELETTHSISVQKDAELLAEIVAITEYPTVLIGSFDENFLEVPSEVIITSMKENQRYFPVFENGKLSNKFVFVSNAITDDSSLITNGNERVLKARLSDAMFFWESDLEKGLDPESLKNVMYMKELGFIYDKELREANIAKVLGEIYKEALIKEVGSEYETLLKRAVMLSKADLTTLMVDEFGELQGVMGSYYTKDEHEAVRVAIKEQYLPDGEKSELPSSVFSSVVALSSKLDTIMGLFSVGKIPTGTRDPYALRRAAIGIIKIVLDKDLSFDLDKILSQISSSYAKFELNQVKEFIFDRLNTIYDTNPSIIHAALKSGESDIKKLDDAIIALDKIAKDEGFKEKFSTFKRLANIIKDDEIKAVDESLIKLEAEKELNDKFKSLNLDLNNYENYLNELFNLKTSIDKFFDDVMINVDDEKIKANRIAIIGQIYKAFLKVADIKEITI